MKKIEAIIKPFKLEEVRDALAGVGIASMTVSEVQGRGHEQGGVGMLRGREYCVDFLPKVKLEIVVVDSLAPTACAAIVSAARTGKPGDGKVFVSIVEEAIRIRTEEKGRFAV